MCISLYVNFTTEDKSCKHYCILVNDMQADIHSVQRSAIYFKKYQQNALLDDIQVDI